MNIVAVLLYKFLIFLEVGKTFYTPTCTYFVCHACKPDLGPMTYTNVFTSFVGQNGSQSQPSDVSYKCQSLIFRPYVENVCLIETCFNHVPLYSDETGRRMPP